MLMQLNCDLTLPTAFTFLERYAKLADRDDRLFSMANYLCQLSLVDVSMNKYPPSLLACGSIYVTKRVNDSENCWSDFLVK